MIQALSLAGLFLALATGLPARAEVPEVVAAEATPQAAGWRVDVTIRHPDTGWDHYADGWEVLAPDGSRLGYRELVHPHEDEQPFTRSLSGIAVPAGTDHLLIRPHCLVDGWSGATFRIDLPG
ncbi:MAG: hypothetical protein CVT84_14970 [Alphaproteobacteria bacterium HGW-Alphaproteobacteria-6]|nr:MAG: hypothetical protein CVT84_14970 [Alphaproteobacteria bacterium HGW-Alphaproteobacteria-6]